MATAESVKAQLESLLAQANSTTGNEDSTLTAAVSALVAGFGQGGGDVDMLSGSFTPAENLSEYTLTFSKPIQSFAVVKHTNALTYGVRTTIAYVKLDGLMFLGVTTNAGGASTTCVMKEVGFTLSDDGMTLIMNSNLYKGTVFVPEQYDWIAW